MFSKHGLLLFSCLIDVEACFVCLCHSCSTSQTGDLTKPDRAVDGIFGFGQQGLSVISQLSSQGITPNAFSHCLNGGNGGGGILVLGQIVEPNLVYTPLVPSQYVSLLLNNFQASMLFLILLGMEKTTQTFQYIFSKLFNFRYEYS